MKRLGGSHSVHDVLWMTSHQIWSGSSSNTTAFSSRFVPGQGVVLYPQIGDKLDIVCPRVDGGVMDGVEYYKVYMVPKEQLESCTITKADTPLLNCVKPDQDVKFTLKFQEFSPNLWGLEFFKGKDYYIICEYGSEPHTHLTQNRSWTSSWSQVQSASLVLSWQETSQNHPPVWNTGGGLNHLRGTDGGCRCRRSDHLQGSARAICEPSQWVGKISETEGGSWVLLLFPESSGSGLNPLSSRVRVLLKPILLHGSGSSCRSEPGNKIN